MGTTWGSGTYVADEGALPVGEPLGKALHVDGWPQALDARLDAYCRRTGRSRAAVTRLALGRYLTAEEARR